MKTYRIEIATGDTWIERGTIKGKTISAILKRAYCANFRGWFESHPQRGNTLMHNRYNEMPILRIIEIA